MPAESLWSHQMTYKRDPTIKFRFAYTGQLKMRPLLQILILFLLCLLNASQKCLCRNSSLGLCQCENDNWGSIQSGMWSSTISPYEDGYIDVQFVEKLSGSVTVVIELG